jgi:hypothetical protein
MRCSTVKSNQKSHLLWYLHKPDYTNFPVYIPILGSLFKKYNCSPGPVTVAAFTNIHRSELPYLIKDKYSMLQYSWSVNKHIPILNVHKTVAQTEVKCCSVVFMEKVTGWEARAENMISKVSLSLYIYWKLIQLQISPACTLFPSAWIFLMSLSWELPTPRRCILMQCSL